MGKAQSKRSLEITTDTKKEGIEDGFGEVKKIGEENEVQLQVNGDTHHNDTETTEKEKAAEGENEKDLTTEKDEHKDKENGNEVEKGHIENGIGSNEDTVIKENSLENGHDETLNGSKTSTPVTAGSGENDEGSKKKKEKKKKWSFRNISFGKRDKQKPAKKEEEAVNGECEKVPEEAAGDNTGNKDHENDTQNNLPKAEEQQTNDTQQVKETIVESNESATSEQPTVQQQQDAAETKTETSPETEAVRESTTTDNKEETETEPAVNDSSKVQEQPNGKSEQTIPVVTIEENGVAKITHEEDDGPVDTPKTENVNEVVVEIIKPTEEIKSATENNCQQTVEMTDEPMKQETD